jgi:hypothetical protein
MGWKDRRMAVGYTNIFPLEKAEECTCRLWSYEIGHSGMYIQVSHNNKPLYYLYFADVRYFSGPVGWYGANFRLIEKPDEHLKMLKAIGCFNNWPQDFCLREHKYTQ